MAIICNNFKALFLWKILMLEPGANNAFINLRTGMEGKGQSWETGRHIQTTKQLMPL